MDNNSLSIDIETFDIAPTSIILSVGCVVFNKLHPIKAFNKSKYFVLDLDEQKTLNRTMSLDTILWWMKQPETLRNDVLFTSNPRMPLLQFITELEYLIKTSNIEDIWANGPDFDLAILINLFNQLEFTFPFTYKKFRDFRTIKDVREHMGLGEMKMNTDLAHNALNDAYFQASVISDTYLRLKEYCGD